jgi:hypothetical protein
MTKTKGTQAIIDEPKIAQATKKAPLPPPPVVVAAPAISPEFARALKKAGKPKKKRKTEREAELRERLWPNVTEDDLWNRTSNDGFTTIPRTMPHIMAIIDALTKGKPASSAYLALWCRVFDSSYLRIQAQEALASESGFSGERKSTVWKVRMRSLVKLGFIHTTEGDSGEFEHVLILNPYVVIKKIISSKPKAIPKQLVRSIAARAIDIGATDCEIEI